MHFLLEQGGLHVGFTGGYWYNASFFRTKIHLDVYPGSFHLYQVIHKPLAEIATAKKKQRLGFCWDICWMGGMDLVGKILLSWNNTSYFMIFLIFCYPFVSSCFSLSGSAKCYWLSMAFLELNLGRAWDGRFSHGELTTSISDIYQATIYSEMSITYPNLPICLSIYVCLYLSNYLYL